MTVPLILYNENILVKQKSLEHRLKAQSKQRGNCTVSGFPWLFRVCTLTQSVVLRRHLVCPGCSYAHLFCLKLFAFYSG